MSKNSKSMMPSGIPYIIGNEAAERFSFYGMKAILVVFMTEYLLGSNGLPDTMNEPEAKFWFHIFVMSAYFFPILGAVISDIFWGKYKTIILLSVVYCVGHIVLALDETRLGLFAGLGLIAVGSGGIKPCVSSHVGDQFSVHNKNLIERVFSYFYLSINLGAAISTLLTPVLLVKYGPSVAFGVPGALMIIATIIFYSGRTSFISIPPAGWQKFKADAFSKDGINTILKLIGIYVFIAIFWALFDQTGSSWVLQAKYPNMIKSIDLTFGILPFEALKFDLLPSQIQAANPILILLLVPVFTFIIYPTLNRFFKLTPLRKISIGMFIAVISFSVVALMETRLQAGHNVHVIWQLFAFVILTAAEVMVSITALEFSYTQAPNSLKSLIMGLFLLSVSLGNLITALVNKIIVNADGTLMLNGAEYFWFFTALMLGTSLVFIFAARLYKPKTYIQSGRDTLEDIIVEE